MRRRKVNKRLDEKEKSKNLLAKKMRFLFNVKANQNHENNKISQKLNIKTRLIITYQKHIS